MATLPSSLALTNIADGSPMVAADVRNSMTAIQTETNALLTILGSGVTGQMFTGNGTTVSMGYPPGFDFAYAELTSTVNVVSTTEGTPTTILSAPAFTFDGATAVYVEFFCEQLVTPSLLASSVFLTLFEGATEITRLAAALTPAAAIMSSPVLARRKITPSAAAHTYSICAHASSTTGTPRVIAGTGGVGQDAPAYIRISKA